MQGKFQERSSLSSRSESVLTCRICHHDCDIKPGEVGKCKIIKNTDNSLVNIYAGQCSNIAVEPIEKRPFYHVSPGTRFLSVGFYGCNFSCNFCQNYRVSQEFHDSKYYGPRELVDLAEERDVQGIAFTYNEPTIYHDYIEQVGNEIGRRSSPLQLAIKTNGFARPYVIRNLCLYVDAINVDIKGDNDDYDKVCGGWLGPVIDCIEQIVHMGVHLEISYLVLPDKIDDIGFNLYLRNWLAELDCRVPIHLLYFYPFHKMTVPSYKPARLIKLADMFSEKLDHVYISNYFGDMLAERRNTFCRSCGKLLIDRRKSTILHQKECCGIPFFGV